MGLVLLPHHVMGRPRSGARLYPGVGEDSNLGGPSVRPSPQTSVESRLTGRPRETRLPCQGSSRESHGTGGRGGDQGPSRCDPVLGRPVVLRSRDGRTDVPRKTESLSRHHLVTSTSVGLGPSLKLRRRMIGRLDP